MRNFQDTFKWRKRSFISAFSICMTVPLRVPSTDYYNSIALHKKWIFSNMFKNFLEELAFLCTETFEKLLQPVAFLKTLLFHRYFLLLFDLSQSFFSCPFQPVTLVPFKLMHASIHQMKDADFWPNSSW